MKLYGIVEVSTKSTLNPFKKLSKKLAKKLFGKKFATKARAELTAAPEVAPVAQIAKAKKPAEPAGFFACAPPQRGTPHHLALL